MLLIHYPFNICHWGLMSLLSSGKMWSVVNDTSWLLRSNRTANKSMHFWNSYVSIVFSSNWDDVSCLGALKQQGSIDTQCKGNKTWIYSVTVTFVVAEVDSGFLGVGRIVHIHCHVNLCCLPVLYYPDSFCYVISNTMSLVVPSE